MPHSSGGGSHGGGSHGGSHSHSHGGGNGNRVSSHYFHGARRYRRHHRNSGLDEYVYANSKPQKGGLSGIIFLGVFGALFAFIIGAGTHTALPKRLNSSIMYVPAVYDDAGLIDNDEELTETITEYYSATGICPVIYTVYDEEWNGMDPASTESYADLETYAYCKYVDNFSDEQHFVIVYSIPESDAEALSEGRITVPNYSWEAVQGDDTDPIITEGFFHFMANRIQKDLESGLGPGVAFNNAFEHAIRDSEETLNPLSFGNILKILRSAVPVLFVGGVVITMLVISIKRYIRDKDVEYEEVPLDANDMASASGVSYSSSYSGSTAFSDSYNPATSAVSRTGPIVVGVISLVFLIPFILSGLGILIAGIFMLSHGDSTASFMLIFGVLWLLITAIPAVKVISVIVKRKKEAAEVTPLTAEYPKAEYPKVNYPQADYPKADYPDFDQDLDSAVPNPFVPLKDQPASPAPFVPSNDRPVSQNPFVPLNDQPAPSSPFVPLKDGPVPSSPFVPLKDGPEFDPKFFEPSKSNIEDDDEDYKRMKRKGFE